MCVCVWGGGDESHLRVSRTDWVNRSFYLGRHYFVVIFIS